MKVNLDLAINTRSNNAGGVVAPENGCRENLECGISKNIIQRNVDFFQNVLLLESMLGRGIGRCQFMI